MSNEEHLEEILHKAHENGFYNELLSKVYQIQNETEQFRSNFIDCVLLYVPLIH